LSQKSIPMIQLLRLVGNHCEVVSTARLPIQPNNGRSISTSTKGADRWNELGNRRSLIARIPPPSSAFYSTNIRAFCRHVISFMNRGHQEAKKVYVQSCLGLTHPGKVTQRSSRARRSSNSNFWKAKLHFRAHTLGSPDDLRKLIALKDLRTWIQCRSDGGGEACCAIATMLRCGIRVCKPTRAQFSRTTCSREDG
jgi:hypothetical protein